MIQPTIILDKSAIHSLSLEELVVLQMFYKVNTLPVLIVEVLGDLSKEHKKGSPAEGVKQLAKKFLPFGSFVNAHCSDLARLSVLGNVIPMDDGRPTVIEKPQKNNHGDLGYFVEETIEEEALVRWKQGEFEPAEEKMAELYRRSIERVDLEKADLLKGLPPVKGPFSTLDDVVAAAMEALDANSSRHDVFKYLVGQIPSGPETPSEIFWAWEGEDCRRLSEYCPYAFYSLHLFASFGIGVRERLVGTRRSNVIDLEYLYYLPFCHVFCSGDDQQLEIAGRFARNDQFIVRSSEMKDDLKKIGEKVLGEPPHMLGNVPMPFRRKPPPANSKSLTYTVWKSLGLHPDSTPESQSRWAYSDVRQDFERLASTISVPLQKCEPSEGSKPQFSFRSRTILGSDPCFCGSGKPISECHARPR